MFLLWNWFSWYTCYCRYYIYTCGFLTFACIPSYRKPSFGFGSRYTILTFCRRCVVVFIFSCLLLGFIDNAMLVTWLKNIDYSSLKNIDYSSTKNGLYNICYFIIDNSKKSYESLITLLRKVDYSLINDNVKSNLKVIINLKLNILNPSDMVTSINNHLYSFYESNKSNNMYKVIANNYTYINDLSNYTHHLNSLCTNFGNYSHMFPHSNQDYYPYQLYLNSDLFDKFKSLSNSLISNKPYLDIYPLLLRCLMWGTFVIIVLSADIMNISYVLNKQEEIHSNKQAERKDDRRITHFFAKDFGTYHTFVYTKGDENILSIVSRANVTVYSEVVNGERLTGIIRISTREDMRNTAAGPLIRHIISPAAWDNFTRNNDARTGNMPLVRQGNTIFVQYETDRFR